MRTKSKPYLEAHFPELLQYKRTASRKYERAEKPNYLDDWWFNFSLSDLETNDFIVFVGALDYNNSNFKVFKVPSSYLSDNLNNFDITPAGWVNLYIDLKSYQDVRNAAGVPFEQFAIN